MTDILEKTESLPETPRPEAETLLLKLRKKMESAVTDEEKRKYSLLVQKLEETLANKTEAAKEGTKDVLAHFKSGLLPDQKTLLESAEKGTSTAAEKGKELASEAVQEAKELSQSAEKAMKDGDVAATAQAVTKVAEKQAKGFLKRFSEAEGIEKLDVIREAGTSIMEKIGHFFALIFSFLTFDSSKIKDAWGNFLGIPKGVQEVGKKGGEIIGKGKELAKMSLEDREKARENMLTKTESYIKEKWLYGEDLSKGRRDELRKIISEHEFSSDALLQFADKANTDGVHASDVAGLIEKTVFNQSGLVLKLALAGIIPMKKIGIAVVDAETKGAKVHFALTLEGLNIPPSTFGFEELQAIADQYKDNPQKRASMLYLLYKPASIFSSIVGGAIGNATSLAIGLSTDTTVDWIKMMKDVWSGHRTAQYDNLIENFAKLEKNLGIPVGQEYAVGMRSLRNLTGYVTNNYRILGLLEKYKGNIAGFVKDPIIMNIVDSNKLKAMANATSETELRWLVGNAMSKGREFGYIEEMKNWWAKVGGSGGGRIIEQTEHLNSVLQIQSRLAVREYTAVKWVGALRDIGKIATISRVQDTTMLMVKDEESLKKLGPAFGKLGAEGIKHVFNGVPLIGLAVASHGLLNDKTKEAGISDIAKETISAFSPFIAGYVLLNEAVVKKDESGSYGVENMEKAVMGGAILGIGGWYSVAGGSLKEFALRASGARAVQQAAETVAAWFRGARVVGRVTPQLGETVAKALKSAEKAPGNGRIKIAIASGTALAVALTIYMKSSKDPYADAVKEGFIDANTGKLTKKFDAAFQSQSTEKKKELLDGVAYSWLKVSGVENPETAYENGMYEVVAKNTAEAKNLQHAVNGFIDDFAGHALGIVEVPIAKEKKIS